MNRQLLFLCCAQIAGSLSFAQPHLAAQRTSALGAASVRMDARGKSPVEIQLPEGKQLPAALFFEEYRRAFGWPNENEARLVRATTDGLGQTHHRFAQYYKGIELVGVQYLLHEKRGTVSLAHGRLVHGLELEVTPRLSERQALLSALRHINAESYLWESPKNEALLKAELHDPNATYYPRGELKLSAGHREPIAENFRLVYRFDIFAQKPFRRDYVDVDARTGEVIATMSRIRYGDVQGRGQSLYNGMVPITVSGADFPTWPPGPSRWHLDAWNSFGGSGQSWWMADPALGTDGGYDDDWYEDLTTGPITLAGNNPALTFYHRYSVETPGRWERFDGYDGMNVQVSTDSGRTWQVLAHPTPPYTCDSLYGFAAMGEGVPGWAGRLYAWTPVTVDLSSFQGQTVQIRFSFASDEGLSTTSTPEFFGWQIDDILVSSSSGILFSNNGVASGMTSHRALRGETVHAAGNYRLRERGRGEGIATYDVMDRWLPLATDFVDDDSVFTDAADLPGVSAHWAVEATYDYFLARHGRNSFDGSGRRIISLANALFYNPDGSRDPNNAMWDGSRIHFGRGDGIRCGPNGTLDIAGHELAHGVNQFSAGLNYENEPGALDESFSDIFGTMVEFSKEGAAGDWLIGENVFFSGDFHRSLANPKARQNPDTYWGAFWVPHSSAPAWENDYGGVHTNCGVQNRWFYLLSEGGTGTNDMGDHYSVQGIGRDKAAQVTYRNLTVYLMPTSAYPDARWGSIHAAIDLYGENSPELQSVLDAWYAVGVVRSYVAPYADDCTVSRSYAVPGHDTLVVRAHIVNPGGQRIKVQAIVETADLAVSDTMLLFDDGMHQDGTAGDGLYGAYWPVRPGERYYAVHTRTTSLDSNRTDFVRYAARFTTVGPVAIESIRTDPDTVRPGDIFEATITLRNHGLVSAAAQVTARMVSLDSFCIASPYTFSLGDIAAGASLRCGAMPLLVQSACPAGHTIAVGLLISSNGVQYWRDTFSVYIAPTVGVIAGEVLPAAYSLSQNYPNPFNPSTTIRYGLPQRSVVRMTVFNSLGQQIAVLDDGEKEAGYHDVQFDGKDLPSGVYFYRLQAGHFAETKKLLLIR